MKNNLPSSVLDFFTDKRMSFKLPTCTHNKLEVICGEKGLSKSEALRQAIDNFIDKNSDRRYDQINDSK